VTTDVRPEITTTVVRSLIAEQFPQWRELPVTPVPRQGWDNRTFRLGDRLSVRLPSADGYVPAVEKENRWLPELAGHLPLPVPSPVAGGRPGAGYPFPWSVRQWLDGETLEEAGEVAGSGWRPTSAAS
jgi:aminoglycoside phosphotransferase (APT) family kinase protein